MVGSKLEVKVGDVVSGQQFFYGPNAAGGMLLLLHKYAKPHSPEHIATTEVRPSPTSGRYIVLQTFYNQKLFQKLSFEVTNNPVVGDFKKEEDAKNKAKDWIAELGKIAYEAHVAAFCLDEK